MCWHILNISYVSRIASLFYVITSFSNAIRPLVLQFHYYNTNYWRWFVQLNIWYKRLTLPWQPETVVNTGSSMTHLSIQSEIDYNMVFIWNIKYKWRFMHKGNYCNLLYEWKISGEFLLHIEFDPRKWDRPPSPPYILSLKRDFCFLKNFNK